MGHQPAFGRAYGRNLLILLGATVLVMTVLVAYRLSVSRGEEIAAAEVATRNYAAIFEARLDASLRRIDADLKSLVREIPLAALNPKSVPRYAQELDPHLDSHLFNFREIAGYRVADAKGDTLYTSASAGTPRINVSDRDYFQMLRDNPKADLVFSEVVTGRSTGREVIAVARALRDPRGEFLGIIYGILELEYLQKLFQAVDLGPQGSITLRRSDNQTLVVRTPHLPMEVNQPLSANHPIVQSRVAGNGLATLQFAAQVDGIHRIVSIHALQHYPFYFIVGVSRDDVLAPWRTRAVVVVTIMLLLLGLVAGVLYRLWRMRERETQILADLSQSEELFREMAEGIDQVFFKAARDYSRIYYISPAFDRIWGHPRAELMNDPAAWGKWMHAEDRERVRRLIALNRDRESALVEFRIVREDGETRWIQAHTFRLANSVEGAVVGLHTDITERKRVEESLEETREKYRGLSEASFDAIFISEKGICLEQNSRAEQMFGYTVEEATGRPGTDWIAPEDRALVIKNMMAGHEQPYDVIALRKDGSTFPASICGKMMNYRGRSVRVTSLTDISGRRQAEQALRDSEAYNKVLFAGSHIPLAVLDPETGRLIDCNQAAVDIYGLDSREAVLAISPADVATPLQYDGRSSAETAFEHLEPALRNGSHVFEWRHRRPSGDVWDAEVHLMAFQHKGKTLLQFSLQDITSRKKAEQALRESEERWKFALEGAGDGVWDWNIQTGHALYSRRWKEMIGFAESEIDNRASEWSDRVHPEDMPRVMTAIQAHMDGNTSSAVVEFRMRCKDGSWRWTLGRGMVVSRDSEGKATRLVGTNADITERKRAEADLRVAATAFESQEGMIITDIEQRILRINRACSEITGYSAEEAVGQTPRLFSSGRHDAAFYREMWASIEESGAWKGELWNRRKNGEVYPEWFSISAVKGEDGKVSHYVASFIDISQRKTAEDEIKHLAFYDPLTYLPNRRLLIDRLRHALIAGSRTESSGALLFIDLDNFKTLNDTLGHGKGDLLLESVARRLTASIREEDTVARLGGDEFVVMLEGLSLNLNDAAAQVRLVGEKILQALNERHDLAGLSYHSTASIGITLFAHQADTVDELLKRADLAMYQAKAAGRNTLRFFDPEMQSVVMARVALEADLREGLQQNHFALYYQPQVAADGSITGAEALLRWRHPRRGMIPPLEFIPLAEETGLILPLGNWVLETACARLKAWAASADTAQLTLAVNVSARQFRHADFVEQVLAVLERSGADPQRLELELTESLLLEDVEGVIAKMTALKARGVCFSLDDFGTGYSSLSYLKRLPLDQLKIDQSFVRDVLTDPNDAAIARTIVALGQSMGLIVIAEGVETRQQRDFLASNGCSNYQGYLFGRPVPADEFEHLLKGA